MSKNRGTESSTESKSSIKEKIKEKLKIDAYRMFVKMFGIVIAEKLFEKDEYSIPFNKKFPFKEAFFNKLAKIAEAQKNPKLKEKMNSWEWNQTGAKTNREINLSVASANYGKLLSSSYKVINNVAKILKVKPEDIRDVVTGSGFERLFQVDSGLDEEQYLLIEMLAAKELLKQSLDGLEKKPEDVDILIIATSIPTSPELRKKIAQAVGLKEDAIVHLYIKACDSSGSALHDIQNGDYDKELKEKFGNKAYTASIIALETGTRMDDKGGDPISGQLFACGVSAMIFKYIPEDSVESERSTFRLLISNTAEIQEGANCLKVIKPSDSWTHEQKEGVKFAPYQTVPGEGKAIDMDPSATTKYFLKNARELVTKTMEEYQNKIFEGKLQNKKIKKVIMHHPSGMVYKGVQKTLSLKYGFAINQMEWVEHNGNAPSFIIPHVMGEQLHDLEKGDVIMVLSYGAGGSFTCQILEIGGE